MKKLLLTIAFLLLFANMSSAEVEFPTKQCVFYDLSDSNFRYAATLPIVLRDRFSLNGIYVPRNTIGLALSLHIGSLKQLKVECPFNEYIFLSVGGAVAVRDLCGDKEIQYGLLGSFFKFTVKF